MTEAGPAPDPTPDGETHTEEATERLEPLEDADPAEDPEAVAPAQPDEVAPTNPDSEV